MPPKVQISLRKASNAVPNLLPVSPATMHPKLIWLYGTSGSGKTYYIRSRHPDAFFKFADCDWKGYTGQPVVAIEDFNLTARKAFQLTFLQWLNNDYIPVYTKPYKKKCIKPTLFIVTSYFHPTDFKHLKPYMRQLLSNVEIIHCSFMSPPPPEVTEVTSDISYVSDDCDYPLTQSDPNSPLSDEDSQINLI